MGVEGNEIDFKLVLDDQEFYRKLESALKQIVENTGKASGGVASSYDKSIQGSLKANELLLKKQRRTIGVEAEKLRISTEEVAQRMLRTTQSTLTHIEGIIKQHNARLQATAKAAQKAEEGIAAKSGSLEAAKKTTARVEDELNRRKKLVLDKTKKYTTEAAEIELKSYAEADKREQARKNKANNETKAPPRKDYSSEQLLRLRESNLKQLNKLNAKMNRAATEYNRSAASGSTMTELNRKKENMKNLEFQIKEFERTLRGIETKLAGVSKSGTTDTSGTDKSLTDQEKLLARRVQLNKDIEQATADHNKRMSKDNYTPSEQRQQGDKIRAYAEELKSVEALLKNIDGKGKLTSTTAVESEESLMSRKEALLDRQKALAKELTTLQDKKTSQSISGKTDSKIDAALKANMAEADANFAKIKSIEALMSNPRNLVKPAVEATTDVAKTTAKKEVKKTEEPEQTVDQKAVAPVMTAFNALMEKYPKIAAGKHRAKTEDNPKTFDANVKYNAELRQQELTYSKELEAIAARLAVTKESQKLVSDALTKYAKKINEITSSKKIEPESKDALKKNTMGIAMGDLREIVKKTIKSGEVVPDIAEANYRKHVKEVMPERRDLRRAGSPEALAKEAENAAARSAEVNNRRVNIYDGRSTGYSRGLGVMRSIYGHNYEDYEPNKRNYQGVGSAESIRGEIALVERELKELARVLKVSSDLGKKTVYENNGAGGYVPTQVSTFRPKKKTGIVGRNKFGGIDSELTTELNKESKRYQTRLADYERDLAAGLNPTKPAEKSFPREVVGTTVPTLVRKIPKIKGGDLLDKNTSKWMSREFSSNKVSKEQVSPMLDAMSGREYSSAMKVLQARKEKLASMQKSLTDMANSVNNAIDPISYARRTPYTDIKNTSSKDMLGPDGKPLSWVDVVNKTFDTQSGGLFSGSPLFGGDPVTGFGSSDLRYGSERMYGATNYMTHKPTYETRAEKYHRRRRASYTRDHANDYEPELSLLGEKKLRESTMERYRQKGTAVSTMVNTRTSFGDDGKMRTHYTGGLPTGYQFKEGEFESAEAERLANEKAERDFTENYRKKAAARLLDDKAKRGALSDNELVEHRAKELGITVKELREQLKAAGAKFGAGRPAGAKNNDPINVNTKEKFDKLSGNVSGDLKTVIDAFGKVAATMEQLMKNTFAEINDMLRSTYKIDGNGRRSNTKPKTQEQLDRAQERAQEQQAKSYVAIAGRMSKSQEDKDQIIKDAELIRQGKKTTGGRTGEEAIASMKTAEFLTKLDNIGVGRSGGGRGRKPSVDGSSGGDKPDRINEHEELSTVEKFFRDGILRSKDPKEFNEYYNKNVGNLLDKNADVKVNKDVKIAEMKEDYIKNFDMLKVALDKTSASAKRIEQSWIDAANTYERLAVKIYRTSAELEQVKRIADVMRTGTPIGGRTPDQMVSDLKSQDVRSNTDAIIAGKKANPVVDKELKDEKALNNQKIATSGIDYGKWEEGKLVAGTIDVLTQKLKGMFDTSSNGAKKASHETGLYFKSITRIASGIAISQMFYNITNAIGAGIGAIATFNSEIEQTSVAFEVMLKSSEKTQNMLMAIQELAVKTPYTFQSATAGVRKLMAYGFSAEQSLPIMDTLADVSVLLGGDEEKLGRIVYAIGQIRSYGKLQAQDLRQLTEAGVPAVDLISKKLGMSTQEFQKAMKKGEISAAEALPALFSALEENFDGAAQKMSDTLKGRLSNVADIGKFLGAGLTKPIYDAVNEALGKLVEKMMGLWDTAKKFGPGGVFEALIPEQYQDSVRRLIAYLSLLGEGLYEILIATGTLKYFILGFFQGMSLAVIGVSTTIKWLGDSLLALSKIDAFKGLASNVGIIVGLLAVVSLSKATGKLMFMLLRLVGVSKVVGTVMSILSYVFLKAAGKADLAAKSIAGLNIVMQTLVKNKIVLIIVAIATAFALLVMNAKKIGEFFLNWGRQLQAAGGVGVGVVTSIGNAFIWLYNTVGALLADLANLIDKTFNVDLSTIFQPIDNMDATKSYQDFLDSLKDDLAGVGSGMEDMGDEADAAKKKIDDLFTASFDELFQIPEPDAGEEDSGSGTSEPDVTDPELPADTEDKKDTDRGGQRPNEDNFHGLGPYFIDVLWRIPKLPTPEIPPLKLGWEPQIDLNKVWADIQEWFKSRIPDFTAELNPSISFDFGTSVDAIDAWTEAINRLRTSLGMAPLPEASISAEVNLRPEPVDLRTKWEALVTFLQGLLGAPLPALVMDKVGVDTSATQTQTSWRTALEGVNGATVTSAAQMKTEWSLLMTNIQANTAAGLAPVRTFWSNTMTNIRTNVTNVTSGIQTSWAGAMTYLKTSVSNIWTNLSASLETLKTNVLKAFKDFCPKFGIGITFPKLSDVIAPLIAGGVAGLAAISNFFAIQRTIVPAFASGGIITKDQIIRAGEGGRGEAIIPLNNGNAMDPFADAIAKRIGGGGGGGNDLPPMYVGTLIADERGLKELERKMRIIRAQEDGRRGL